MYQGSDNSHHQGDASRFNAFYKDFHMICRHFAEVIIFHFSFEGDDLGKFYCKIKNCEAVNTIKLNYKKHSTHSIPKNRSIFYLLISCLPVSPVGHMEVMWGYKISDDLPALTLSKKQ